MSIYDEISTELPGMRADAESLMTDTGSAYRPTGRSTQDPVSGDENPLFDTIETGGCCKIQGTSVVGRDPQARTVNVGGLELPVIEAGLHRPWDSEPMRPGDEWLITEAGPSSDPSLSGRRYRLVPAVNAPSGVLGQAKSFATARRYDVIELPGS